MSNIVKAFFEEARLNGERCCFHHNQHGIWRKLLWGETADLVLRLASAIRSIGVKPGDKVGILSQTRMEWTLADLSIMSCGAVTVPIYPTMPESRMEYILKDADISFVFVENTSLREILTRIAGRLGKPLKIIQIADDIGKPSDLSMAKALVHKPGINFTPIKEQIENIKDDDAATIIYTSGTTGTPKGVVLTHKNIIAEVNATRDIFHFEPNEIGLLCLPLSHVLGRLMQYHQLADGYQLAFLESYDKFADNCLEIKPHLIVGVPRMVEKIYERLLTLLEKESDWKKSLFNKAVRVGKERGEKTQKHVKPSALLSCKYWLAHKLVFKKLLDRLGGRVKIFVCGGAPLNKDLAKFFHALGFLILEGYGLTETFAAATVNRPDDFHFGTVGKPIPGIQLKIAPDGEVMLKGPTIFKEYLNQPEELKKVMTQDGWFLTGDVGELSRDGFLRITDRKKDIIITAGGQNVAPQMIESFLMENRFINHCMVYGDKKKYLTAIITLNTETTLEYARKEGLNISITDLPDHPKIYELIDSIIKEKNSQLARHETIKKFAILDHDFSEGNGELTPTMKVRRKFTSEKYRDILESLYEE